MESEIQLRPLARHAMVAAAGLALAIIVALALTLEPRYALSFIFGILLLGAAMPMVRGMSDLLLYALAFNLSFTSIEKTFFRLEQTTFVISGVPVGMAEICLFGLYALWFSRIFILKTSPLPRPRHMDWWVLAFWGVHLLSMLTATSSGLVLVELIRLGKYGLLYFYLAHKLQRRHLKWIAAGIMFTALTQSSLAIVQYGQGKLLGIGRTKGAADLDYEQYTVTGFENVRRAEGTTFDSHALGLLCAMLLPLPLGLALTRGMPRSARIVVGTVFVCGVPGLVASFTRAGWLAFAGAAAALLVSLAAGQYRNALRQLAAGTLMAAAVGAIALVPLIPKIRQRLFEAPPELVTARVETLDMGMAMWRVHPWTGRGANNYMHTLEKEFSIFEGDPYFIPAHNMLVFVLTELGVIGLIVFLCLGSVACVMNWQVARSANDALVQTVAGALFAGLVAVFIEGISDPIYVTTVTYFTLWFQLGLGAGLYNITRGSAQRRQLAHTKSIA